MGGGGQGRGESIVKHREAENRTAVKKKRKSQGPAARKTRNGTNFRKITVGVKLKNK